MTVCLLLIFDVAELGRNTRIHPWAGQMSREAHEMYQNYYRALPRYPQARPRHEHHGHHRNHARVGWRAEPWAVGGKSVEEMRRTRI